MTSITFISCKKLNFLLSLIQVSLFCSVLVCKLLLVLVFCAFSLWIGREKEADSELRRLVAEKRIKPQEMGGIRMLKRHRNKQIPTALTGAIALVFGLFMFIPFAQAEQIAQQTRSPQFKVAQANLCGAGFGWEIVDRNTQRHGMHCCPLGMFVTGVHVGENELLCEGGFGGYSEIDEIVDTGTQFYEEYPPLYEEYPPKNRTGMRIGRSMHTCPRGWAMTGIHVGKNQFT